MTINDPNNLLNQNTGLLGELASEREKANATRIANDVAKGLLESEAKQAELELAKSKAAAAEQKKEIQELESQSHFANKSANRAQTRNLELAVQYAELDEKLRRYEKFLAKPLKELFIEHEKLQLAHKNQRKSLSDWMASQLVFHSLAHSYAAELNLTVDDVAERYKELLPTFQEQVRTGTWKKSS